MPITPGRQAEYDAYRATFPDAIQERRCELIDRMFRGFTAAEGRRRTDLDPAWGAELDRRCQANLSPEEHAEMKRLDAILDAWEAGAPWARDIEEKRQEDDARMAAACARLGLAWPPANPGVPSHDA
jgi:hypothetical protein